MSSKKRIDKNEPEFKASKNLFEAIKRRSNKNLKETRNSFKKSDLWTFDGFQTKLLWKLEILQKLLLLKVFFT